MTRDDLIKEIEQRIGDTCGLWISDEAAAAVLRVCAEELLGNPYGNEPFAGNVMVLNFLKNRRALYSPPKPKTPEERVTISPQKGGKLFVCLDDEAVAEVFTSTTQTGDRQVAEMVRLGLIAELKLKEQPKC